MIIACLAAVAIDGDSIRCSNLGQVRLLGIDAPDRQNSAPCHGGYGNHVCDTAAATNAKKAMRSLLRLGSVKSEPVGRDRYGRTLAVVYAAVTNINCRMLSAQGVRYIARYDNGGRVARACR